MAEIFAVKASALVTIRGGRNPGGGDDGPFPKERKRGSFPFYCALPPHRKDLNSAFGLRAAEKGKRRSVALCAYEGNTILMYDFRDCSFICISCERKKEVLARRGETLRRGTWKKLRP